MTERKPRQGQKKPDGTKATPKPLCPKCGEYLQSCYIRGSAEENRSMKKIGLCCPSSTCDYIEKDLVDLTEETESMNELEND
jgi:hypothetical protein